MKMDRKAFGIGLAASILILASVLASINILVDRNGDRLVQEIQKSLGRKLAFDKVRPDFWGGLGLSVRQFRVAEDQHFAATPFIQTRQLRLQLRWLPLLLGRVEVKRLILDEPEIQIIRNEAGNLNLSALAVPQESQRETREKRTQATPRLLVSSVRVANGKIYYVDRSSKEPVEIQVRNVDLDLRGLTSTPKFQLAANLFEAQGQNVSVEGRIGPLQAESEWAQQPVDLKVRADPLLLSQLARALPSLRENADFYLGITGPIALKARLLGTIQRPRITDLRLKAAVFGSTRNNVMVSGEWDFAHAVSWTHGIIKGKITVDPINFDQLRNLPAVRRALPSSLATAGLLSLAADLEGPWDALKAQLRIKASESDIQYGEWFKKAKGVLGEIEVKGKREKGRLLFEPSTLALHNMKLTFSGVLENSADQRLNLTLRSGRINLTGWERLLPFVSSYGLSGNLGVDLSVKRNSSPGDGNLDLQGNLNLVGIRLRDKKGRRDIEKMTALVSFSGREARIDNGVVRLGSSDLVFDAAVDDLSRPVVRYALRSPKVNLADLTGAEAYKTDAMTSLSSTGEVDARTGKTWLRGDISSAEGVLQELPYRNLRGKIAWSPGSLSFQNISLQTLSGTLRGSGNWATGLETSERIALETRIESVDLKSLLNQKFPEFKDHIEGRLTLNAKLRGAGKNGTPLHENLQGEGTTQVRDGTIRDFNLIDLVLSKVGGLPGMSNLIYPRMSQRYGAMLKRHDTPFNSLTASFTVKQDRILSKDFHMATPDYSIYGEGWIGFDKSMKWSATLVMSGPFTQEPMQEHGNIRYLLDRQGRLTIPFRIEGTFPRLQAKPDVQKITEAIQRGFSARRRDRSLGTEQSQREKGAQKRPAR